MLFPRRQFRARTRLSALLGLPARPRCGLAKSNSADTWTNTVKEGSARPELFWRVSISLMFKSIFKKETENNLAIHKQNVKFTGLIQAGETSVIRTE